MNSTIVAMAGLPATGKSTLAARLAQEVNGIVLDKDRIRAAVFPPQFIEYSRQQDDLCMNMLLTAAEYLLRSHPIPFVFLDGRPFARTYQIEQVASFADRLQCRLKIIQTGCSEATVRARLQQQSSSHPASNRDLDLYESLKGDWQEITYPKLLVNTDESLSQAVNVSLSYLRE